MLRDCFLLCCNADASGRDRRRCPSCANAAPIHASWIYEDPPSIRSGSSSLAPSVRLTLCSWDLSLRGPSRGCNCRCSCTHPTSVLSHNLMWSFPPPSATSADLLCDTRHVGPFLPTSQSELIPGRGSICRRGGRFVPPVRLRPGPPLRHFIHSPQRSCIFFLIPTQDLAAFLHGKCPNPRNRPRPDPTLRHPGFADPPSRSDLHPPQRSSSISSHPPRQLLGLVSRGSWRLPVDMVFFVDHVEEKRYRSASIDVEHVWHTRGSEERETSQGSTEKRWWKWRREKGLRRGETRDGPGSRNVRRLGNEWTQNVLQRQHGHGKATTWVPGSVEKSRDLEHGRGCEAHSTGDREGCQELVGHRTSTWRRTTEKWQVLQAPLVQPTGSSPQQRTV